MIEWCTPTLESNQLAEFYEERSAEDLLCGIGCNHGGNRNQVAKDVI